MQNRLSQLMKSAGKAQSSERGKSVMEKIQRKDAEQNFLSEPKARVGLSQWVVQLMCNTPMPLFVIHPEWTIKYIWDLCILLFVFYNALTLPFYVGFNVTPSAALKTFEDVLDACFIIDMVCSLRTGFEDRGVLITNTKDMASIYFKSWFFVDLLAVMPFEKMLGGNVENVRMFGAVKCIRLLRLGRFAKRLESWKELKVAKVFVLMLGFAVLAHWVACAWGLLNQEEATWYEENQLKGEPIITVYLDCLYTSTILLLGENINPTSDGLRAFSFLMVVVGSLFYAVIFGNMSHIVSELDRENASYNAKMELINEELEHMKVPMELKIRVRAYFHAMWNFNRSRFKGYSLLTDISESLRVEVLMNTSKDTLLKVPFLQDCGMEFILGISVRLKTELYMVGEIVFEEGEEGDGMFFIEEGMVEVYSVKKGVTFITLQKGDYVGDLALILGGPRNASVRASKVTILKSLSKEDFDHMCDLYPEQTAKIRNFIAAKKNVIERQNSIHIDEKSGTFSLGASLPGQTGTLTTSVESGSDSPPMIAQNFGRLKTLPAYPSTTSSQNAAVNNGVRSSISMLRAVEGKPTQLVTNSSSSPNKSVLSLFTNTSPLPNKIVLPLFDRAKSVLPLFNSEPRLALESAPTPHLSRTLSDTQSVLGNRESYKMQSAVHAAQAFLKLKNKRSQSRGASPSRGSSPVRALGSGSQIGSPHLSAIDVGEFGHLGAISMDRFEGLEKSVESLTRNLDDLDLIGHHRFEMLEKKVEGIDGKLDRVLLLLKELGRKQMDGKMSVHPGNLPAPKGSSREPTLQSSNSLRNLALPKL